MDFSVSLNCKINTNKLKNSCVLRPMIKINPLFNLKSNALLTEVNLEH